MSWGKIGPTLLFSNCLNFQPNDESGSYLKRNEKHFRNEFEVVKTKVLDEKIASGRFERANGEGKNRENPGKKIGPLLRSKCVC